MNIKRSSRTYHAGVSGHVGSEDVLHDGLQRLLLRGAQLLQDSALLVARAEVACGQGAAGEEGNGRRCC